MKEVQDLYIGLSSLREKPAKGKRGSQDDAICLPGLFLDIDFADRKNSAKNYPRDKNEALSILQKLEFQPTSIIATGNGLHVHFDFDMPLIIDGKANLASAKNLSANFQRFAIAHFKSHDREIDSVGDIFRNYRIPGTFNHKGGESKPVEFIKYDPNQRINLEKLTEKFITFKGGRSKPPKKGDSEHNANHEKIMQGCQWYREEVVENAANAPEPVWFAGASITGRCENGKNIFLEYSSLHNDFDANAASEKLQKALEGSGPRTCDNVCNELGYEEICSQCPHFGKIKSPIQLGQLRKRRYDRAIRRVKRWSDLKDVWLEYKDKIEAIRETLDFLVPIEILVPVNNTEETLEQFRQSILDICAARNNNVQLAVDTKARRF